MKAKYVFLALFIICVTTFLLHHAITGQSIYSDGVTYYAYLRSAVIDRDINHTNEIGHYKNSTSKISGMPAITETQQMRKFVTENTQKTGYYPNHQSIGTPLLWTPFYLATHTATKLWNTFMTVPQTQTSENTPALNKILIKTFSPVTRNGYGTPYELSVGLASITYAILGAIIAYKLCQKWFTKKTSLLATTTVMLTTPILWYITIEPAWSHATSFFLASLFIYVWYTKRKKNVWWIPIGLIFGLAVLTRRQNAILILLPLLGWTHDFLSSVYMKTLRNILKQATLLTLPAIPLYAIQLLIWKKMFGTWLWTLNPKTPIAAFTTHTRILTMITSPKCGLLIMPVIALSLIGLYLFTQKKSLLGAAFLTIFTLQFLIMSFWGATQGSICHEGYPLRFFINLTPLYAIGTGTIMTKLEQKGRKTQIKQLIFFAIALNLAIIAKNALIGG